MLIGRTVFALFVDNVAHTLYFVTECGAYAFEVEGDCCSESWYADILGFDALKGSKIIGVRALSIDCPEDGRTRQESDSAYGVELRTLRGRVTIAYRCSSNGYYGGWMRDGNELEELPRGLKEITDDWSA